ncbi:MAG: NfeD family protein [Lachnospiraceae bacterium]|nr:NfeD family protein [Lachnospiraceae bacterium]
MQIESIWWLGIMIVLLVIELATLGLTTVWFAGGALAAFIASLVGASGWLQVILFLAVSIVLLIFTRPFAVRYINKNTVATNADSLIGKTAIVTEDISNLESKGQVQVQGQIWTARSTEDETKIEKDTKVVIEKISGVKLIVRKV